MSPLAHENPEGQARPCYIPLTLLHPLNFHQFARFYGDEYGKNRGKLERHNVSRIAGVLTLTLTLTLTRHLRSRDSSRRRGTATTPAGAGQIKLC